MLCLRARRQAGGERQVRRCAAAHASSARVARNGLRANPSALGTSRPALAATRRWSTLFPPLAPALGRRGRPARAYSRRHP